MATLTRQSVGAPAGTTISFASAAEAGDKVEPGTNVYLLVRNGSGGSITVTLDATGLTFNGGNVPDTAKAVAAGAVAMIPVTPEYRNSSDGLAAITYSGVSSLTVAALIV